MSFTNIWKQFGSNNHYLFTLFQINYIRGLTITIFNFSIHFYNQKKCYFS